MINYSEMRERIKAQWQVMIQAGRIPVMEWKMSNGDWLAVDINLHISEQKPYYTESKAWLAFTFDQDNKPCFFDGCITGKHGFYKYPLDEYFDSLDHYLQEISNNIIEGYLIPNGLYAEEE